MNNFPKICKNSEYIKMLRVIGQLSNLFSTSDIPFLHYRIAENVFCKYNAATNLSRADMAYDAKIGNCGIGIKTFIFEGDTSTQKIAEFDKLSSVLSTLKGENLAMQLCDLRNERIRVSNELYNIKDSVYHIIGRKSGALEIFNAPYSFIDTKKVNVIRDSPSGITFSDEKHLYNFNKGKSTLLQRFVKPEANAVFTVQIEILQDPYTVLEKLISQYSEENNTSSTAKQASVILPLFSGRGGDKKVPAKSGLNQWNASGRPRNPNEVYIPVPIEIHRQYPNFFPGREEPFCLKLPDGSKLKAKICQDNGKALMSDPNKALGEWILRKILNLKEGELVTMDTLNRAGFDSVIVYKDNNNEGDIPTYSIEVRRSPSPLPPKR